MKIKRFPVEAVIHVLNRCNQLLNRKSGTHNVKQEYYYWIEWLQVQFKHFHKIHENSKKKVLRTLDKVDKFLIKDIGKFNK